MSGKSASKYTSYSLIFNLLHSVINEGQHRNFSKINPDITEHKKMRLAPQLLIENQVCHSIMPLCFALLLLQTTIQEKNNVRNTPSSAVSTSGVTRLLLKPGQRLGKGWASHLLKQHTYTCSYGHQYSFQNMLYYIAILYARYLSYITIAMINLQVYKKYRLIQAPLVP